MRRLVAVTAALALSLTACGGSEEPAEQAAGWSFTDSRGTTVTLPERPDRVVAQVSAAGALNDLGIEVVGTFGPLQRADGTVEPEAGSLDPAAVVDVTGPAYGEVDLERLAGLEPDLVVSGWYPEFEGLWHLTADPEQAVLDLAPTVGVAQAPGAATAQALPDFIASYRDLAGALGADVGQATADQEAFDTAAERLRAIGARMRDEGRSVLAVGGTTDEYFVVVPARNPDLAWYVDELGLPITTPDAPDAAGGGYFERLSWEQAGRYGGDVLVYDARPDSFGPEQLLAQPVLAAQPAAAAGRFVAWEAVAPLSARSYAGIMDRLADGLETALF